MTRLELSPQARLAILDHARQEHPRECCGLLVAVKGKQRYIPCTNMAELDKDFFLSPDDYVKVEEEYGPPLAVVHSHPNKSPTPTMADKVGCEGSELPWVIVGYPNEQFHIMEPEGYTPPLIGRPFCHGVLDCYSLVRDYYWQELRIQLPDFPREERWWLKGKAMYMDHYAEAGFRIVPIEGPQPHDLILMQLHSSTPNHGAIYLGGDKILHHVHGRLSSKEVYGGYWRKITVSNLRHKEVECRAT